MTINDRIDADFKSAMKSKNELELSTLRLVRSSLKNKQIEVGHELEESEVTATIKTLRKQLLDALADFEQAGRQDLIDRQRGQIDVLDRFLPVAMSGEELEKIVKEAIEASGATQFGQAMGIVMKAVEGRAEGNAVREIVQRLLSDQ